MCTCFGHELLSGVYALGCWISQGGSDPQWTGASLAQWAPCRLPAVECGCCPGFHSRSGFQGHSLGSWRCESKRTAWQMRYSLCTDALVMALVPWLDPNLPPPCGTQGDSPHTAPSPHMVISHLALPLQTVLQVWTCLASPHISVTVSEWLSVRSLPALSRSDSHCSQPNTLAQEWWSLVTALAQEWQSLQSLCWLSLGVMVTVVTVLVQLCSNDHCGHLADLVQEWQSPRPETTGDRGLGHSHPTCGPSAVTEPPSDSSRPLWWDGGSCASLLFP